MPASCAVRWCKNIQSVSFNKNISFHRFPVKDPTLLNRWLLNLNILKYNRNSVVCSDHFKTDDYKLHTEKKLLKNTAVPLASLEKTPPKGLKPLQMLVPSEQKPVESKLRKQFCGRKLNFLLDESNTSSCSLEKIIAVPDKGNQCKGLDHTYSCLSPKEALLRINFLMKELNRQSSKITLLSQKNRRLHHRLLEKENIVVDLKKQLKNCHCSVLLEGQFNETLKDLLKVHSKEGKPSHYPPTIKKFAVSMHFYSPHAYNFLRQLITLPHPRTIRKWAASINGNAGFTMETIHQIQQEVRKSDRPTYATLIFDEMAIKKQLDFDGKEVIGHCNFGREFLSNDDNLAKEALVFYCKGFNASWKYPVGYCLVSGMDADTKTLMIMEYIKKIEETGAHLVALTCDGTNTNLNVLNNFGISTNGTSNCSFTYSYENFNSGKIRGILDPAHMLKLLRNLLADMGILFDNEGGKIEWRYIVMLNDLQKQEGIHCGNKLRDKHIHFQNQKMKVNIAAQTLSSSVANALLFLKNVLLLPQYKDVEPTVKFLQIVNNTFDILNSVDVSGKGSKAPIRIQNQEYIKHTLDNSIKYFLTLKLPDGTLVYQSRRKAPAVGFILGAHSILSLAEEFVWSENPPLKYILGRNLSQDHIEQFFSCLRKRTD